MLVTCFHCDGINSYIPSASSATNPWQHGKVQTSKQAKWRCAKWLDEGNSFSGDGGYNNTLSDQMCFQNQSPRHTSHMVTNVLRYVHFEGSALLQYDIAPMHNQFQKFQWNTVPSHSRVQIPEKSCKISRPFTMKAKDYPMTQFYIPEQLNPQNYTLWKPQNLQL